MTAELNALIITAASIGFFHTILGPDHYLPFVMMSWARKWSGLKTALITVLCGLGHIGSSIVLGLIGVSVGIAVNKLEFVEGFRGNLAAWLLIVFGLVYLVWGLRRAYRNRPHVHSHTHATEDEHTHHHDHHREHTHVHNDVTRASVAPWALFVIFVFGPCEALIPFLMYPALRGNGFGGVALVTFVFGAVTLVTMLSVVLFARAGVNFLPLARVERFSHAIAGAAILICGLTIQFLGF
ncbi:MAG: hypothetical protein FVQ85_02155 [Planctomycetes bacterium]|nr:hypothetical protein [Planctomycetota bacterium]